MSRDVPSAVDAVRDTGHRRRTDAAHVIRIPLPVRLPNVEPTYVDRGIIAPTHVDTASRTPVTILYGDPGLGKTCEAVRLATILRQRDERPAAFLNAQAFAFGGIESKLREVLSLGDTIAPDWALLSTDRDAARAALVDLADAGSWIFVLDDLDLERDTLALLNSVRNYARRSRWIITTQRRPSTAELSGQNIHVPRWSTAHLEQLSRLLAVSPDTTPLIVRDADGSPRQLIALDAPEEAPAFERRVSETRNVLALLKRPLDSAALRAAGVEVDDAFDALVRRGQVTRVGRGWIARFNEDSGDLGPEATRNRHVDAIATSLAAHDDDDARLEALRLRLARNDIDQAARILETWGPALFERGFAKDIWYLLRDAPPATRDTEPLPQWRAWSAYEWRAVEAAHDVHEPPPDTWPRAALATRLRIGRGDFEGAIQSATLEAEFAPTDALHDMAVVKAARAAFSMGKPNETLAWLRTCRDPGSAEQAEHLTLRAECAVVGGDPSLGGKLADEAIERAETEPPAIRLRAYLGAARVHLMRQRLRDAERVIEALLRVRADRVSENISGRTAIELAAAISIQRGRLDRTASLCARLLGGARPEAARSLFTRTYLMVIDELRSSPRTHRAAAYQLRTDCEADGSPMSLDVRAFIDTTSARIAIDLGISPDVLAPPSPPTCPTPSLATARDIVRDIHLARWGRSLDVRTDETPGYVEHDLLRAMRDACAAATSNQVRSAEMQIRVACDLADEAGYTLHTLWTLRLLGLIQWRRAAWSELETTAARLDHAATEVGATRIIEEAEFFARLAAGPLDAAWVEIVADRDGQSCIVHRWCRWILGDDVPLDLLEAQSMAAAIAAARIQRAARVNTPTEAAPSWPRNVDPIEFPHDTGWRTGYGIDTTRRVVWSRAGVVTDLARHDILFAILAAIARREGRASKEALITDVWDIKSYHPLRHDNRLRVAVKKLRDRIKGPENGPWIEALDDGYALTGVWRWIPDGNPEEDATGETG